MTPVSLFWETGREVSSTGRPMTRSADMAKAADEVLAPLHAARGAARAGAGVRLPPPRRGQGHPVWH